MITINKIAVNSFATRHTTEAPLSHSTLPLEEVANLLLVADMEEGYPPANYNEGGRVIIAKLPENLNQHFYSAVCLIKEGEEIFEGFRSRVEGEEPRPYREVPRSEKPQAQKVALIFYNSLALSLTGDNELDPHTENWELISINAYPDNDDSMPPITPYALKANYYGWDGGTPTDMSEEEFNQMLRLSESYWTPRAFVRLTNG
jgi:hypothetical protein